MHFGALGKIGDPASALGGRIIAKRPPPAAHQSSRGSQQMGKDAQEARFAGAVRPDQPDELAALDRGVDPVQHGSSPEPDGDALRFEPHQIASRRRRSTSSRKNGAPISAVRTPSRNSGPVRSQRTAISAARTRHPPPSALGTSSRLGSCPTNGRSKYGMTRPTNPIAPLTATAAPT